MKSRCMPLAALVMSWILASDHASAGVIEYTDRAAFESAISGSTLFDFESLLDGGAIPLGNAPVFGAATVISTNSSGIYATTGFGAPTQQVGSQNSGGVRVSLSPGYKALGMDIGALFGTATFSFTLRSQSSSILFSGNRIVADNDNLGLANTTFFGYVSDTDEIGSLEFTSIGGSDFETLDNLIYGNAAVNAVPEPATVTLLGLGAVGLMMTRRRRQANDNA